MIEHILWRPKWTIERYTDYKAYRDGKPYNIAFIEGNLLLNTGINTLFTLLCGGKATPFDAEHARIGVGDSNIVTQATQTGLQGTNKAYASMEYGYPQYGSNQKAIFRAVFDANNGNFTWDEFVVDNGSVTLNRVVSAQGIKTLGEVWVVVLEVTLA